MNRWKKSFRYASNKIDGKIRKNKVDSDQEYIRLEKDAEELKKAMLIFKKNLDKYLEPRPGYRFRISGESQNIMTFKNSATNESEVTDKFKSLTSSLNGASESGIEIFVDTFKNLNDYKMSLEKFYIENVRPLIELEFEFAYTKIKKTEKNVQLAKAEADVIKGNKKSTTEMIESSKYNFQVQKISRQNLLLDYNENCHVERIEIWISIYKVFIKYHEDSLKTFATHLSKLEELKTQMDILGKKPHFKVEINPIISGPISFNSFSSKSSSFNQPKEVSSNVESDEQNPHISINNTQSTCYESVVESNDNETTVESNENKTTVEPNHNKTDEIQPISQKNSADCFAIAQFDFIADCEDELTFDEGDKIKILSRVDENWIVGELDGKSGYIPISYVEISK